jgi:quercetin dioxygenase-like cupin family protein
MKGVKIKKIKPVHEDERRALVEIFNGDFIAEQVKMLRVKSDAVLGNHYHPYKQFFYMLKGEAGYIFVNIKTGEKEEIKVSEGDFVVIDKEIAHATRQKGGNITIEGNEKAYTSPEADDLKYNIIDP